MCYLKGKCEVFFRKSVPALWTTYGLLDRRKTVDFGNECDIAYNVVNRIETTHDSFALVLLPKEKFVQKLPIGYHLSISIPSAGKNIFISHQFDLYLFIT